MSPLLDLAVRATALSTALVGSLAAQEVRFNRDVRPILSDRCFQCHGVDAKARKAGLRVDTLEGLTTPIEGRTPVVPGEPGNSEILRRVSSTDPKFVMPPPSTHKTVTAAEQDILRRWIAQGAEFEEHWAFVPPERPPVPAPAEDAWSRSTIDRFILDELRAHGLAPRPDADAETLLRRITLDLTGLPPTIEEIGAFFAAGADDKAYEAAVDRLLASPHFGERLAHVWLDAARYADTNGFHHDNVRTAWPYRDWVIEAFQDNKPYDEFVIEQLAGDLLPDPSVDQRIATAFCRMHNINDEGGAIDAEYRVEAIADRIETISTTFLGLTMTCARCHDHKYDPLTQDDYYSLYATFGSVDERGVYPNNFEQSRAYPARLDFKPGDLGERMVAADAALAAIEVEMQAIEPDVRRELDAWERELRDGLGIDWVDTELADVRTEHGTELEFLDDGSVRAAGNPSKETFTFVLREPAGLRDLRVVRLEALTDAKFAKDSSGLSSHGNSVVSRITAEVVSLDDPELRQEIEFGWAWADHEQTNGDFDILNALRDTGHGWALAGHQRIEPRTALLLSSEPFGFGGGTEIRVHVECASRYSQHVIGRPRVSVARAHAGATAALPVVVSDWWEAGPFAEETFEEAWDKAHGPESVTHIDRDAKFGKVGWKHRPGIDGESQRLKGSKRAWYFAKTLHTPVAREVPISLGSDDSIRVWLDGEIVHENKAMRGVAPDQEKLTLALAPGEHVLVVKIVNNGGVGGFYGRVDRAEDAPDPAAPLAWVPRARRDDAADRRLLDAFGERSPTYRRLDAKRSELAAARTALDDEVVPVVVMDELEEPKPTYVLSRGNYMLPNEERRVERRPPAALGGEFPPAAPHDRLGFAQWLVRPENPLTARVHVNRIWQMLFGTGLVATAENFGLQGEWPSHPGLLDWLAVEFRASGWDQKALIRSIVTSSVYRQQAVASPEALAFDPDNRLLSFFPRRRLVGEFVRDLALAVSGLLVDDVGGPSVRPYQPPGLWREVSIGGSSNTQRFERDDGEDLYRRSLYTFWKRTSPNPQMATFDAPTREFCVVQRGATNTPLQALVIWNDEQFVEAARALAERTLREAGTRRARIEHMFRLCTGRRPSHRDREILDATLTDFVSRYSDAGEDATALASVGELRIPDDIDTRDLAAWTMLANTVLSLDETIVRD